MKHLLVILLLLPVLLQAQTVNVRLSDGTDNMREFWNNWTINAKPDTSTYLVDVMGNQTKIQAVLQTYISIFDNGAGYLAGKSIFPDTVARKGVYNSGIVSLTLTGLDDSSIYTLSFFASRNRTDGQGTAFYIAGFPADTLMTDTNASKTATFTDVTSTKGVITVKMWQKSIYDYLNAIQIVGRPKHPTLKAVITIDSTVINYPRSFVKVTADSSIGSVASQWSIISGPPGAIFASFGDTMYIAGLVPGFYGVRLWVQDSLGNLDSAIASVTVNGAPSCPVCAVCPTCPPPITCPTCPACPPPPALRTVVDLSFDFFTHTALITYSDGTIQSLTMP